jgi:hypothetical protein
MHKKRADNGRTEETKKRAISKATTQDYPWFMIGSVASLKRLRCNVHHATLQRSRGGFSQNGDH